MAGEHDIGWVDEEGCIVWNEEACAMMAEKTGAARHDIERKIQTIVDEKGIPSNAITIICLEHMFRLLFKPKQIERKPYSEPPSEPPSEPHSK